jgi:hypothetical protein
MENSNNDAPKPGTEEYDRAMIAKYRGQPAPRQDAEDAEYSSVEVLVPHGTTDPYGSTAGRMGLSVRKDSTLGPDFGRGRLDPGQLVDMRADIARLYEQLREVIHHDPTTGEPVYRQQGQNRTDRMRRLVMLESQLPVLEAAIAKQQEADAAAGGPPKPGSLEALLAEKARQDQVRARAEEIAFEREAQAMADRVARERSSQG